MKVIKEVINMRLWDYRLLKVLPDKFIIAQWRECIAIKRQWEKGTLKHRLVSYVIDHDKQYFRNYVELVCDEMAKRKINYNYSYLNEIYNFCEPPKYGLQISPFKRYSEHNDRYLRQCYYNLQEKYDRGIVTEEEWLKIYNKFKDI